MHGLLLRKTLLFVILWGGVFSVFPQTQAISCCWPWCCCYREPDVIKSPRKPPRKPPTERDHLLINEGRTAVEYREPPSQTLALPSSSTLPLSNPTPPDVVLMTQSIGSGKPSVPVLSSVSLIARQDDLPLVSSASLRPSPVVYGIPGWANNDEIFPLIREGIWAGGYKQGQYIVFGDEPDSPTLDEDLTHKFKTVGPKNWQKCTEEAHIAKFAKKVEHYTFIEAKPRVALFLNTVKEQWDRSPELLEVYAFSGSRFYYCFMRTPTRLRYVRISIVKNVNDADTLSRPTTRVNSVAPSQQSSPKKGAPETPINPDDGPY